MTSNKQSEKKRHKNLKIEKATKAFSKRQAGKKEKMIFYDIETGETITEEKLLSEYMMNKKENPSEYDYTFPEYVNNCLTINNGTLEIIIGEN